MVLGIVLGSVNNARARTDVPDALILTISIFHRESCANLGKADRSERRKTDTFAHIGRACTIDASRRLRNRSRGSP